MKRPGVLTWLFALMLSVSLFGPVIAQVSAQEDVQSPTAESTTVADDLLPPDVTTTPETVATQAPVDSPVVNEGAPPVVEATETAESEIASTETTGGVADAPVVQAADVVAEADQVPTADLTVYSNIAGSNVALLGAEFAVYSGSCPATGSPVAGPTFVVTDGIYADVIFTALPLGMYCIVETTTPAGYTSNNLTGQVDLQAALGTDFQHTLTPETADLTLYKVDTENARVPGAGFTIYDEPTCSTVIKTEQIVGAADDPNPGNVGRTVFTDLPLGDYCVVESTVPAGYVGSEPVYLTVDEDGTSWSLINTRILADLSIYKVDAENARVPGAGITIYDETCTTLVRGEQSVGAADDPDPGNVGRAIFNDLPTGNYCVVESTVPEGYTGSDPVVVEVVEGGTSWSLINERQTGTFEIQKLVCPGDPADSRIEIDHDVAPAELVVCELATTGYTFLIYPFGEEPAIGPVGPGSFEGIPTTTSTSGEHRIVEVGTDLEAEFTLAAGEHLVIRVLNFEWPTGSLYVAKIYCDPDVTGVEYDVYDPVVTIDDVNIELPTGCYAGNASFLIYPYGDLKATPIAFATNGSVAWIKGLPVTTNETGKHLLVEVETGASVLFGIAPERITPIRVTNLYTTPVKPDEDVTTVKELPKTGVGSSRELAGYAPFLILVVVVLTSGVVLRRRPTR